MIKHLPIFTISLITLLTGCSSNQLVADNNQIKQQPLKLDYIANIQVVRDQTSQNNQTISGYVFNDENGNGIKDINETGVEAVAVSNGVDVVRTDANGKYSLPVRDDMSLFVVQPSGWRVPTNQDYVPQFAYEHKPNGSPKAFRYGGLAPTGPLPSAVNFPIKEANQSEFTCVILGDTQSYANQDISFFRDSTIDDLLDRDLQPECVIAVGDIMGDDLTLIPRMTQVIGSLKAPQWWTHGNHDFDFDADFDKDSADSWRNLWGPAYYAFEQGNVLFVVLDNVVYPCGPADTQIPGREFCVTGESKRYNGRITDEQLQFVEALLDTTAFDKTVVVAHHIPFVSFVDQTQAAHQTDNVTQLYELLEGRNALSISGHTHTIENLSPGDSFYGWQQQVNVDALPFRHIIAGAASGAWYQGDFDIHGTPMSLQRMGAPKGYLTLEFNKDGSYKEDYHGANYGRERVAWLSINTPEFRTWFDIINQWRLSPKAERDPIPPLSINDLPDVKILIPSDLEEGSFLTANVWSGSTQTKVTVSINNGPENYMSRTQQAKGEKANIGALYADPFAAQRQLTVARTAIQSNSGELGNQGYQVFKGTQRGPDVPQPQSAVADRNVHLWTYKLPTNLAIGTHVAEVQITDRHGRVFIDRLAFEVKSDRPEMRFKRQQWEAFDNGAPINRR